MDAVSLVSPVLRGPFTGRARREVAFCVLTLPFGVFIPLAGFFATVDAGLLLGSGADGNPSGQAVAAAVAVAALLTVLLVTTGAAAAGQPQRSRAGGPYRRRSRLAGPGIPAAEVPGHAA